MTSSPTPQPDPQADAIAAHMRAQEWDEAFALVESRLAREPTDADAWYLRGKIMQGRGDGANAIVAFNNAVKFRRDFVEACVALCELLDEQGTLPLAIRTYEYLMTIAPQHKRGRKRLAELHKAFKQAEIWCDKGLDFALRGDMPNAVIAYRKALAAHPGQPIALANLALAYHTLREMELAQKTIESAIRLRPAYAEALNTLGSVLKDRGKYHESAEAYRQAVRHNPDYVDAWFNFGHLLYKFGNEEGAINAYREVLRVEPNHAMALADLTMRLHVICRWEGLDEIKTRLRDAILGGQCANPFIVVLNIPAAEQCINARIWSAKWYPMARPFAPDRALPFAARKGGRLRIGYLSADFCYHATAFLISEMFERHDRTRFEIYAYSCSALPPDATRARIEQAVDVFRDIHLMDNQSAAALIESDGIDILVDLKGYTENQRMDLMALRPAPLQMHYLGYPGTTGAPFIDYFIADPVAAPEGADALFTEKLIRLPHSYQMNDRKRFVPAAGKKRSEYGLPEKGFVFCDFNNTYKITPAIFDVWMRLLAAVEGSVLWLFEPYNETTQNLRREAEKRGIDGARIITAAKVRQDEHLARYLHADLVLDTFPVCGHTTASDALWCGVPVVTLAGDSFVSRVAASLLQAVELPGLVTTNLADYEALALALARDPARLNTLRLHLEEGRMRFPLFDSEATTRALEAAYRHAAKLHGEGRAPEAFALTPALEIK